MALTPASSRSALQAPARISGGVAADLVDTLTIASPNAAGEGIDVIKCLNAAGDITFETDVDGTVNIRFRTINSLFELFDSTPAGILSFPVSGATPDAFQFGKAGGVRLRLVSGYAANPSNPSPQGAADIFILDTGAAQELRVRYNDGGTMRTGSVALT